MKFFFTNYLLAPEIVRKNFGISHVFYKKTVIQSVSRPSSCVDPRKNNTDPYHTVLLISAMAQPCNNNMHRANDAESENAITDKLVPTGSPDRSSQCTQTCVKEIMQLKLYWPRAFLLC